MMASRTGNGLNKRSQRAGIGWRVNVLIGILFILAAGVFLRLFSISYLQHEALSKIADTQYRNAEAAKIARGEILIHTSDPDKTVPVATKSEFPYLYAIPRASRDPVGAVEALAAIAPELPKEKIFEYLSKKDDPFELIQKNISEEMIRKVEELNMPEFRVGYEAGRFYPQGSFLSHTLGFLGFSGDERTGQYGIEGYYEDILSEGGTVLLTVDQSVQSVIERNLDEIMERWSAKGGTIIVQDSQTGAITAIASSPSFDPNNYSQYPLKQFLNPAIQEIFEPGSTFKVITMSGGLDMLKINPLTTYTDAGEVKFGDYVIKNFDQKAHGVTTMTQVLEKSLNTGAVFVEKLLGDDAFLQYVTNFGFGRKTEIELAGEVAGNISNLNRDRGVNSATASFGQGISVTPIQLITAYSAVANGGKLMRPYIVDKVQYADGRTDKTTPVITGVPISDKTSAQLKQMLSSVVERGFDRARVPGYDVAAKTGTAQIAKAGGYSDEFIHDMVGFAPAFSPKFTILIKIERPQGIKFAADSLSPAFRDITKFLLHYYNIAPTRPDEVKAEVAN